MDASERLFLVTIDTEMQRMTHRGKTMMGGSKRTMLYPHWNVSE